MHTEQAKRFAFPEPLRLLPLVLISLFVVVAAVDAMLAFQPTVLRPLRDGWQHWVGASGVAPAGASVFATGIAVAGIAIAAAILSSFVRGVRTAPYVWLAPIVVGSGTAMMAGLHVELPVPFPPSAFALVSACLLLGGGVLIRSDSLAMRCGAALMLAAPLIFLAVGYSQVSSSLQMHGVTQLAIVLVLTTLATTLLGYATGNAGLDSDARSAQLIEMLERAKAAEARATFAEQQLAGAGHGSYAVHSPRLERDDEVLARMRGGGSGQLLLWAALFSLAASVATGYFAGYVPLENRLGAQRRLAQTKDEQHVHAMTALRSRFDEERSALKAQLRAAQPALAAPASAPAVNAEPAVSDKTEAKKADPAPAQAAPAQAAKKAEPAPTLAAPTQATEPPARAKAKAAASAVHARAASTHAAAPARKKKTPARAAAKPAATKGAAPAAQVHYDDESMNDDPIGGL